MVSTLRIKVAGVNDDIFIACGFHWEKTNPLTTTNVFGEGRLKKTM